MRTLLLVAALFVLIFASALNLVLLRHQSKTLFMALQESREQRDDLDREWGQLLLEQGTAGANLRVDAIAREQLGMIAPAPAQIVKVQP